MKLINPIGAFDQATFASMQVFYGRRLTFVPTKTQLISHNHISRHELTPHLTRQIRRPHILHTITPHPPPSAPTDSSPVLAHALTPA